MTDVTTRSPGAEDCIELWRYIREDDEREALASSGSRFPEIVFEAVTRSAEVYAVRFDGELAAIYGVVDAPEASTFLCRVGYVWMLTTEVVEAKPITFWRESRPRLVDLLRRWDVLINAIDCRYERAIRWGERLGFRFAPPAPFGHEGRDFQIFSVTREA